LHGNEPAGVHALEDVIARLQHDRPPFKGSVLGLRGNLAALNRGVRSIEYDLNRIWTTDHLAAARCGGSGDDGPATGPEHEEMLDILARCDEVIQSAGGPVLFLDLHSTSGEGPPFLILARNPDNLRRAARFPVPAVLGLETMFQGTLIDFMRARGHAGFAIEGGKNDDPETVAYQRALLWAAFHAEGSIKDPEICSEDGIVGKLAGRVAALPRQVEMHYRHSIGREDGFRMRNGYRNFQTVRKGEVVGEDREGPVAVPMSGILMFPLYQEQGTDGFFIAEPVG